MGEKKTDGEKEGKENETVNCSVFVCDGGQKRGGGRKRTGNGHSHIN